MSMSNRGCFNGLASMGFDRPNIQAFHSAAVGTEGTTFSINGMDNSISNDPTPSCSITTGFAP